MKTSLSPAASVVPTAEDLFFGTTGMALRAAGIQLLSGNVRQPKEAVRRRTQWSHEIRLREHVTPSWKWNNSGMAGTSPNSLA